MKFPMPRLLLTVFILAGLRPAAAAEPVFRAGADRTDVTPELGVVIVGNFVTPASTHVHDPLYARTLVLDDGTTRLAFVVVDNVGLPRFVCDAAKRLIRERTGLPPANVLISSTHTHSAGSARDRVGGGTDEIRDGFETTVPPLGPYQRFLATRIADSVRNALQRLEPAKIGWGAGSAPAHVFNRRWHVQSEELRRNPFGGMDAVRMNPPATNPAELIKPAGPTDPEIVFLSVQAANGRPLALLANYSLHYVGGTVAGALSADYFGMFAERLRELLGGDAAAAPFVGIMANGTSGDVNNIDFRARPVPAAPYEKMRRVGEAVAAEVHRAYGNVVHVPWVKLDARLEEVRLATRRPSAELVAYAQSRLAPAAGKAWHPNEKLYARHVLRAAEGPTEVDVPVQAIRVGDVGIAALPIEVFAETGLELKVKAPWAKAFTVSIANGAYGYMPTPAQHQLGGYESWLGTNRVEPAASTKMTDCVFRLWREMQ
jgi:hypothetical protein